jgi:hypothetical protein
MKLIFLCLSLFLVGCGGPKWFLVQETRENDKYILGERSSLETCHYEAEERRAQSLFLPVRVFNYYCVELPN